MFQVCFVFCFFVRGISDEEIEDEENRKNERALMKVSLDIPSRSATMISMATAASKTPSEMNGENDLPRTTVSQTDRNEQKESTPTRPLGYVKQSSATTPEDLAAFLDSKSPSPVSGSPDNAMVTSKHRSPSPKDEKPRKVPISNHRAAMAISATDMADSIKDLATDNKVSRGSSKQPESGKDCVTKNDNASRLSPLLTATAAAPPLPPPNVCSHPTPSKPNSQNPLEIISIPCNTDNKLPGRLKSSSEPLSPDPLYAEPNLEPEYDGLYVKGEDTPVGRHFLHRFKQLNLSG